MSTTAAAIAGDGDVDEDVDVAGSEHALAAEEWLASRVLEHVSDAREVCMLALVNKNFWAASLSDLVWQKRLPPKPLLDAIFTPTLLTPTSKRDLYIHLCKSISYENGLKKFWLDPASGGDCHMISARALTIIWGDSPQYWKWKPWPGAMFPEVAYLHTVCWFDIKGTFKQILTPGKYMVSYRIQVTTPRAGWGGSPIKLSLQNTTYAHPPHQSQVLFDSAVFKRRLCPLPNTPLGAEALITSDTETVLHQQGLDLNDLPIGCMGSNAPVERERGRGLLSVFVNEFGTFVRRPYGRGTCTRPPEAESQAATLVISDTNSESDGEESGLETFAPSKWVECDAGEFIVDDDNEGRPIEIQFSMLEVEVLWWKGGFILDGVIIRPSHVAEKLTIE